MSKFSYKTFLSGLALGLAVAFPALAGDISISGQMAHIEEHEGHGFKLDVFMLIENAGAADRIYAVRSKVAKIGQISGGEDERGSRGHGHAEHLIATVIDVPAKGSIELHEDGHHIQLIDLKRKVEAGDTVQITLFFEKAGRVKIDVPVMEEHDM